MSNLAGKTSSPDDFSADSITDEDLLSYCKSVNDGFGMTMLFLFKAQAYYLRGNYKRALEFLEKTEALTAVLSGNAVLDSTYRMIYVLTLLAVINEAGEKAQGYKEKINGFREQLKIWADNNASNFEHKHFLVEAEYERSKGNILETIKLYRKAVVSSEKYDFAREAALVHLKVGEFWMANEILLYAQVHFVKARTAFDKLGYKGLVDQIDSNYNSIISYSPKLAANEIPFSSVPQSLSSNAIVQMDLQSVLKASHALSEEIILDKLIYKMLRIVIENAGGQRVVFTDTGFW
jgi:tetratricopeptide (TPR) repeat protein